jgi:hypothetical protein
VNIPKDLASGKASFNNLKKKWKRAAMSESYLAACWSFILIYSVLINFLLISISYFFKNIYLLPYLLTSNISNQAVNKIRMNRRELIIKWELFRRHGPWSIVRH